MADTNATWSEVKAGWEKSPDSRLKVASLLVNGEIGPAIEARSERHDRWDQLETFYYDRTTARTYSPYDGAADFHFAIVQPKLDALTSFVVGTLTSADPVCRAKPYGKADQSVLARKEEVVWAFLKEAGLVKKLDELSPVAGYTNCAHLFCYWKEGLSLEGVRPKEVAVWPVATVDDPKDAKSLFRRLWVRKRVVEARQDLPARVDDPMTGFDRPNPKKWLKDRPCSDGSDPRRESDGARGNSVVHTQGDSTKILDDRGWPVENEKAPHSPTAKEDGLVELYEGTFMAPGPEGTDVLWSGVIDYRAQSFLHVEPLYDRKGYTRHCAFKFGYKPETGFGYYPRSSVADNLQHDQLYANELASLAVDGIRFSIFGTVFASSYSGTSGDTRTEPGQIVLGMVLEPQGVMIPRPDLTYLLPMLSLLSQHADSVAHISNEGQAGQARKGTTATEVEARQVGQAAGVSSYIRCFGKPIEDLFAYAEGLVLEHFDEAKATPVGLSLGLSDDDREALALPVCWKLAAANPLATPMSQMQFVQSALVPLKQVFPANGIDDYAVTERLIQYAERAMGVDGTGLQSPRGPEAQIVNLAKTLQVDPGMLAAAVQAVKEHADQAQEAAMGGQMGTGVGGAPGEPPGGFGEAPFGGLAGGGGLLGLAGAGPEPGGEVPPLGMAPGRL